MRRKRENTGSRSGLMLTASMAGIVFCAQARATDFKIVSGQLLPNPNQAGDVILISGSANSNTDYHNAGAIELSNGATLSNFSFFSAPVFTNAQAGTVTNSGMNVLAFPGGGGSYSHSQLTNQGTWINTDSGTTVRNLHGAILANGSISFSQFPPVSTPPPVHFSNQQGATVINSGTYAVKFSQYTDYKPSEISNQALFTNRDKGSLISNQNGGWINNNGYTDDGTTPAKATMINGNGAVLNNSGAFIWENGIGYQNTISSSINNNALFHNSGNDSRLNNLDGAKIHNGSRIWASVTASPNTLFSNDSGATLTNSGAQTFVGAGGYTNLLQSTISNTQATLQNIGAGSRLVNDNGAVINNDGYSYVSSLSNHPTEIHNQDGAILSNTGAYAWRDETGASRVNPSQITNNNATLINSGSGSQLHNLNGALLSNYSGNSSSNLAIITNQNGAMLINSGAYQWQDENGQRQVRASTISNGGELINTGNGTVLKNLAGAEFSNQFGTVKNQDGAVMENGAGSVFGNYGRVINDALITNAGSFRAFGATEGNGQYVQTAGETVLGGALTQWTQASTLIQGGVLRGVGELNGNLQIDGGTLAPGDPDSFRSNFPISHPGLILNGDLTINNGVIKINVGSDGNPFGLVSTSTATLFANAPLVFPFPLSGGKPATDRLSVNGSVSFNGGVIEIDFLNGYAPSLGESLAWLTATNGISGLDNIQYRVTGLANDRKLAFNSNEGTVSWTVTSAPVPVPTAGWLFISGLLFALKTGQNRLRQIC